MRIWNVNPRAMCRKHLLGEHVELHMMVGTLLRGISMQGYYSTGLIDTRLIRPRHEALVQEMASRGYAHSSPLLDFVDPEQGRIRPESHAELRRRCPECFSLFADSLKSSGV